MANALIESIARNENLVHLDKSSSYRCNHPYCPSSIHILSTQVENEESRYFLSYIPHNHNSTLYSANPSTLPAFLQIVMYYHSGCEYFKQHSSSSPSSSSSSSSLLNHMIDQERQLFFSGWVNCLQETAIKDFSHAMDDEIVNHCNARDEMNGR